MLRWDHPPLVTSSEIFLKKMRGYGKIRKIMEVTMNMSNHCSTHYRYCSITQSFSDDSQKMDENLLEYDCLWKSDLENGKSKRQVVSAVFTYDESQTLRNDLLLLILLFKLDEFIALYTVQA